MASSDLLDFGGVSPGSRLVTVWKYLKSQNPKLHVEGNIEESKVLAWLGANPLRQDVVAGLRLIDLKSPGFRKFPLRKETFDNMLEKLKLPILQLHWNVFFVGGCEAYLVGSGESANFSFVIGGGIFSYSVGGIFTFDPQSNITRGTMISGCDIQRELLEKIPAEFIKVPHPMMMPVLMAEILMDVAIAERDKCMQQIKRIEFKTGSRTESEPDSQAGTISNNRISNAFPNYRSLTIELSKANRRFGISQMSFERSRLLLEFAVNCLRPSEDNPFATSLSRLRNLEEETSIVMSRAKLMLSSIAYMKVEQENLSKRFHSQNMVVSNLIAQQDVSLSVDVAKDSRELADASRRDSSGMLIIAGLGTFFLPGTFTAALLALPFFNWDDGTLWWIYPVVTIPLTLITIGVVYALFRWRELKNAESAAKARRSGPDRLTAWPPVSALPLTRRNDVDNIMLDEEGLLNVE